MKNSSEWNNSKDTSPPEEGNVTTSSSTSPTTSTASTITSSRTPSSAHPPPQQQQQQQQQQRHQHQEEEDEIVYLARMQALNAAKIAAASTSNKHKWTLSNIGIVVGGGPQGVGLKDEESMDLQQPLHSSWGHEQQRMLIQQRNNVGISNPTTTTTSKQPLPQQQPQQPQQQQHNPIGAIRAGWEGIIEKSQLKLEEIQKDLSKGVVAHVPFLDRGKSDVSDQDSSTTVLHPPSLDSISNDPHESIHHHHIHQDCLTSEVRSLDTDSLLSSNLTQSSNLQMIPPSSSKNVDNQNIKHDHLIPKANYNHSNSNMTTPLSSPKVSSKEQNMTSFTTNLSSTTHKDEAIVQSVIVWKRRSGYGKYSIRNAWEQRKLVLDGSTLQYFDIHSFDGKEKVDGETDQNKSSIDVGSSDAVTSSILSAQSIEEDEEDSSAQDFHDREDNTGLLSAPSPATTPKSSQMKNKKDIRQLWEQAKENITLSIDGVKENFHSFDLTHLKQKDITSSKNSPSDPNQATTNLPRGTIDLVKENAAIAAISVTDANSKWISNERTKHKSVLTNVGTINSPPPTPFGLSIMVKGETKWKLCFETQREQILWLALLTDVVVQRSVDSYNEELIKSSVSGGVSLNLSTAVFTPTLVPPVPSLGLTSTASKNETVHPQVLRSPGNQKGALWQTESKYSLVKAVNSIDQSDDRHVQENNRSENVHTSCYGHHTNVLDSNDPYLIRKIHDWVDRSACKDPNISLSGLNLVFCGIFTNILLLKAFVTESKVVCCLLVIIMNVFVGLCMTKYPTSSNARNMGLRSFLLDIWIPSHKSTIQDGKINDEEDHEENERTCISEPPALIRHGFKPVVGSTTLRVANESEPDLVNGTQFIRWTSLDNQLVQVRSHGYLTTKKKIPSPDSLYEVIAVEVCQSETQIRRFVEKVNLPPSSLPIVNDKSERTWISPDIFVISLAVPTEEPSFSRSTTDGGGITVVSIYRMKEETRKVLKIVTSSGYDASKCHNVVGNKNTINAIKLFEKWCRNSPTDEKMQGRFKMIPNVHNLDEVGLPSYISKYCGKPVLIKRVNVTGFLSNHPELNAMEFDITLHPFPYLAKKAMSYLYDNIFAKAIISLSYVIEGRDDDELPEALIGDGVKLLRPDPELTVKALNLFDGTSKRSFDTTNDTKTKQE